MRAPLRPSAVLAVLALAVLAAGCDDDCDTFCSNQADHIEECLPQFEQEWTDVGAGEWASSGDFQAACVAQVDDELARQVEETCTDEATAGDCEATLRQGVVGACTDYIDYFGQSCSDYWRSTTDFTPQAFDPERPAPGDDDDSAAGDDDDATEPGCNCNSSLAGAGWGVLVLLPLVRRRRVG
jgi:hypothetical protein